MRFELRERTGLVWQVGASAAAVALLHLPGLGGSLHAATNAAVSRVTAASLRAFGLDALSLDDHVYSPFYTLQVIDRCNPLLALALVLPVAFVARSTARTRLGVAALLGSIVVGTNQVRLAALVLLGNLVPERVDALDHGLVRLQYWGVVLFAVGVALRTRPRGDLP